MDTKLTIRDRGVVTLSADLLAHLGVQKGEEVGVQKGDGGRLIFQRVVSVSPEILAELEALRAEKAGRAAEAAVVEDTPAGPGEADAETPQQQPSGLSE